MNQKRTTPIRKLTVIFLGLALVCLLGALLIASAGGSTEVTLTVGQSFESNVPDAPSDTFTYRLVSLEANNPMPAGSDAEGYTFTIAGTGEVQIGPIQFTETGIFSYELSVIPSDARGYTYDTRVFRIRVQVMNDTPDNLSVSNLTSLVTIHEVRDGVVVVKVDDILFEHSYDRYMMNVAGTKTWEHGANPISERPEFITVHVMDGETRVVTAVVSEADHWMWAFTLPRTRDDGSEIIYTIAEEPVAGYETIVNGFNITNRHESVGQRPDHVLLEGQKTWDFGNDPENRRPQSITVLVKDGDRVVARVTTSANDNWRWSAFVPRYDADGNVIQYTIGEENVPRYTLTVNGYNLHNRFVSPTFPGDSPKTYDDSNIVLWSIVALASFLTLLVVLVIRRKKSKHNNNLQE